MLLERLAELGHLAGELLALLWCALQVGQSFSGLFVVVEGLGDEILRLFVLSQHRKKVLLPQAHLQLELFLELREEALAGFDGVARGLDKLGKELVRLRRTGLDELSNVWHVLLRKARAAECFLRRRMQC